MIEAEGEGEEPRVVRLALDLVAFCDRIEPDILARGKRAVNEHLQDAAASSVANVGEGWDEPRVREKRKFFIYALRSAGECQRELPAAARVRAIGGAELTEGLERIRAFKIDLWRLISWCERRIAEADADTQ